MSSGWRRKGLVLVLALLVSGCGANAAMKKQRAEEKQNTGLMFLRAGQASKALQYFLKALEDNPKDPYLHYDLAQAYASKGAFDQALEHLREAIRLKPNYAQAYNTMGVILFNRGQVDQAIESYHKALSNLLYLNPQDAHYNLGIAYLSRKEYEKAAGHLEIAIRLVPDFVAAYNSLGKAYEGLKKYRLARRAYEKALEFAPGYAEAHLNLGKLLYSSGERQKAVEHLREVLRLAPDSDNAREAQLYLGRLGDKAKVFPARR